MTARRLSIAILAPDISSGGMTRALWLALALRHLGHEVQISGPLIAGPQVYPTPPEGLRVVCAHGTTFDDVLRSTLDVTRGSDLLLAIKPRRFSYGIALASRRTDPRPLVLDVDDWERGPFEGRDRSTSDVAKRLVVNPLRSARSVMAHLRRALDAGSRLGLNRLERMTHQADAVTADSRFLQARYDAFYVPNGKDTQLFDPGRFDAGECRRRHGLDGQRVLMFPGTVLPHKGLEDLLAATQELDWPDLRLLVVGGRRTGFGDHLCAQHADRVIRLPRFPLASMPAVVAAAHVVVVPQRDTALARAQCPMKLTDGMAMAKPVLTTRVGDIPEIVQDTAFLARPSAPSELADQITRIFDDYGAALERGRRARERCKAHYGIESTAATLSRALGQATGERSTRAVAGRE